MSCKSGITAKMSLQLAKSNNGLFGFQNENRRCSSLANQDSGDGTRTILPTGMLARMENTKITGGFVLGFDSMQDALAFYRDRGWTIIDDLLVSLDHYGSYRDTYVLFKNGRYVVLQVVGANLQGMQGADRVQEIVLSEELDIVRSGLFKTDPADKENRR